MDNSQRAVGPDILRGLAILLVLTTHFPGDHFPPVFADYIQPFGWLGVDIFFVLSGYLIGTELMRPVHAGKAPDLRVFYIKRLFRILPVFWLIVALYFAFPILQEGPTIAPPWRFLTFTLNFGLDIRTERTFSHAWSLCVEEHFYLVLPVLILLFRRARQIWLPFVCAAVVLVGGLILRHHLWTVWQAEGGQPVDFLKLIYYPSYCRIDGLLMGVCLAAARLFYPATYERIARPFITLPLAAVCLGVTGYLNLQTGQILTEIGSTIFYPLFSLGIACLLSAVLDCEAFVRPARWTGIGFIAAISYSLYLSQKITMHVDKLLLPEAWLTGWSGIAIFYVTTIAVGAGLYFAVERPFMLLRRRALSHFQSANEKPLVSSN